MVRLTITPALIAAINATRSIEIIEDNDINPSLEDPQLGDPITHTQVLAISKALRTQDRLPKSVSPHLDGLLRGSIVYHEPPKPKVEPTSEYKSLMARLRREEEVRAYERMINPPVPIETFQQRFPGAASPQLFSPSQADVGEDEETTYADINRQMALIINVLVSIVACSVAIWLAARHWSTPSRLGLSMGGSGMVGVAEVAVYAGYIRRLKEAREKGKKQIEIKEIVKTWVIGADNKEDIAPIPASEKKEPIQEMRRRAARKR